jgi:hypothetical protein
MGGARRGYASVIHATEDAVAYSGGKDSTLLVHRLLRDPRYEIESLVVTLAGHERRSTSHMVPEALALAQGPATATSSSKTYEPTRTTYLPLTAVSCSARFGARIQRRWCRRPGAPRLCRQWLVRPSLSGQGTEPRTDRSPAASSDRVVIPPSTTVHRGAFFLRLKGCQSGAEQGALRAHYLKIVFTLLRFI